MKIKIISCKNPILWYSSRIGEDFEVTREDLVSFWVMESTVPYRCINWVYKEDVEVL